MSQSRTEAGQSMEEILASIRRIIAEGERDAQESAGQPDRTEPGAAAASQPPVADKVEEAAQAEVLVLTEMLQEDGSVVSLQSTASAPASPDEAAVDDLLRKTLLADTGLSSAASVSVEAAPVTAEIAVAPKPQPLPEPPPAAKPSPPAETPAPRKAAEPAADKLPAWLSPTPSPPPPKEERVPVSSEGLKKPELVSEEALAASTAALAQLAQSVTRTREPAPGASKTVEEVVREAVEPLLKQWLDQHLPRIVERMVREAIDRVVRRVE